MRSISPTSMKGVRVLERLSKIHKIPHLQRKIKLTRNVPHSFIVRPKFVHSHCHRLSFCSTNSIGTGLKWTPKRTLQWGSSPLLCRTTFSLLYKPWSLSPTFTRSPSKIFLHRELLLSFLVTPNAPKRPPPLVTFELSVLFSPSSRSSLTEPVKRRFRGLQTGILNDNGHFTLTFGNSR